MIVMFFLLPKPDSDNDLLTAAETAAMIGKAERTLLARRGGTITLPRQPGRPARYRRGNVIEWLRARAERANPTKPKPVRLLTRKKHDGQAA